MAKGNWFRRMRITVQNALRKVQKKTAAFWTGVVLLVINSPIGWLALSLGTFLAKRAHDAQYLFYGTLIYIFTWLMAFAGALLAGPKGFRLIKKVLRKGKERVLGQNKPTEPHVAQATCNQNMRSGTAFLLLGWFAFLGVIAFLVFLYYLALPRMAELSSFLAYAVGAIFTLSTIVLGGGLFLITLTVITGRDFLYPHDGAQITMRVLPPVIYLLGTWVFRQDKDNLRESFVWVSNMLFWAQARHGRFRAERILILLPHCVQFHRCPWKVTWSIEQCKGCGSCSLSTLSKLHDKNGVSVYVATGGTVARRVIIESRPTMVLAVACARDLSEGMIDVYPIPVFGVLLTRPNGPCFDTCLDLSRVRAFLQAFRPDIVFPEDEQ